MLIKRIITSSLLIAMIIAVIFLDWLCALVITLFIALGLWEFFGMLEKKGVVVYKYFGMALGVLIPLSIMLRFELTKGWEFLFVVLSILFLVLMQIKRRESSGAILGISTTIFGIIYIAWFFSFLIKVRYLYSGLELLSALLLITKSCDIGAYLIGSRFGKTPLVPNISPNKTVEGALAGTAFSVLVSLGCAPLLNLSYFHLIIIALAISLLAQLGDLSESLIKRDCKVKDSGNILPGMGGILDQIDSLLFTAPAFYFYVTAVLQK